MYFSSKAKLTDINEGRNEMGDNTIKIYPNPFNSETRIRYKLNITTRVEIKLFDILGREIQTFVNEEKNAGEYEMHFNANYIASGVYLLILRTDNQNIFRKILITK